MDLTGRNHAERANRLTNLGNAFLRRYERTAEPSDLDVAIETLQRGIDSATPSHDEWEATRLTAVRHPRRS